MKKGGGKMRKILSLIVFILLYSVVYSNAWAYFIVALEQGSVLYDKNNKLTKDKPMNKVYYEVDEQKGIITRTKVVIIKTGEIIPDATVYQIVSPKEQQSIVSRDRVIHAVGQPGLNAYELLTIAPKSVMSAKSTGDYVVIFNSKITERSDVP